MFGANVVSSGLSLSKVLRGISQTLNIANQVIPIYKEAKPLISNAKNIFSVFTEFKNVPLKKNESQNDNKKNIKIKDSLSNVDSKPVFFQ